MLFDLSIALRLRHDLSKVVAPTPRSGACETWVPLGPQRLGSRPPTSGSGLLEDPPTCQVGPTDLVGGPHDLLKTSQKIPQTTSFRMKKLGIQDKISVNFDQADRHMWQML
jgi:hypothetical protein